jgi:type IX secretion system PorP/SprF family membrane protein
MNRKKIFSLFFVLFQILSLSAQDLYFSQFFLNSLDQNPAVAGTAIDPRLFLHYRNQWPSFGSTFITYQGSYDQYIPKINGGLGLNVIRDNIAAGAITNTQLDLIYSYRLKVTKKFNLHMGLQASFQFFNVDAKSLGATEIPPYQTTQPDFAFGFLGVTRFSQYGISVNHLNSGFIRFNYNYVVSPFRVNFYYAHNFSLYNPNKIQPRVFTLTPAILVQKQSGSTYLNYGVNLQQSNLMAGIWLRTNLPMQMTTTIFSVGFTLGTWQFGYSYDYNLLSMKNIMPVTGAHEITITTVFPLDPKRKRFGPVSCPKFIE